MPAGTHTRVFKWHDLSNGNKWLTIQQCAPCARANTHARKHMELHYAYIKNQETTLFERKLQESGVNTDVFDTMD